MPDNVKFKPNVPLFLALADPTGELDQWNQVTYPTTCGRLLTVSYHTAVKINELGLEPGERFCLCKDMESDRGPASWRAWRSPEAEKARAAVEPPSELEAQLGASIAMAQNAGPREVKRKPVTPQKAFEWDRRGTGTHGPAPLPAAIPALAKAPTRTDRPAPIPYNVAFREVTAFVTKELDTIGEQWNDQAKQDLISTILIAAAKQGILTIWERGNG